MVANGRFSTRPLTIAGVMCGSAASSVSGAEFRSMRPLPTCAPASEPEPSAKPSVASVMTEKKQRRDIEQLLCDANHCRTADPHGDETQTRAPTGPAAPGY